MLRLRNRIDGLTESDALLTRILLNEPFVYFEALSRGCPIIFDYDLPFVEARTSLRLAFKDRLFKPAGDEAHSTDLSQMLKLWKSVFSVTSKEIFSKTFEFNNTSKWFFTICAISPVHAFHNNGAPIRELSKAQKVISLIITRSE